MEVRHKKIAAALAAVNMYLEEETAEFTTRPEPAPVFSAWSLSGRQTIMNNRQLVTARLWK